MDPDGAGPAAQATTLPTLTAALDALEAAWKPHWRHLSSPQQLTEAIRPAVQAATDRAAQA